MKGVYSKEAIHSVVESLKAMSSVFSNDVHVVYESEEDAIYIGVANSRKSIRALFKLNTSDLINNYQATVKDIGLWDAKQFVNAKMGDYSFTTLAYKGIPFIPVAHTNFDTAGDRRCYFIVSDTIAFFYDPDLWWAWTDWKEPDDRPFDKVKQVVCSMNLGVGNPRNNHVLFDIGEAS